MRDLTKAVAMAIAVAALAPAASAGAAPEDVLATAAYGEAELRLQRTPADRTRRELVFKASASANPRVLPVEVPVRDKRAPSDWSENVALGMDGRGALAAVVQSARGLYWTPVEGATRLRHVPDTTRADARPSLFRGRVASIRSSGDAHSAVLLRSLRGGRARTIWRNRSNPEYFAVEAAAAAADSVVVYAHRDGALAGAARVSLARPGRRTRRLYAVGFGNAEFAGVSIEVAPSGRRLTVSVGTDEWDKAFAFALPSGRRLGRYGVALEHLPTAAGTGPVHGWRPRARAAGWRTQSGVGP